MKAVLIITDKNTKQQNTVKHYYLFIIFTHRIIPLRESETKVKKVK